MNDSDGNGEGRVSHLAPFMSRARGSGNHLPAPDRERYSPLRVGIVNLWQYDDHEFVFERGRLLLRGENGMGKSKALEVLLPFLLDANLAPERLDPFGDRAKSMRWNLLEDDRVASRVGYVFIEFGRRADAGNEYVTLGAGLRATRSTSGVDSWYFVARARRGADFDIVEARVPHTKDRLREALGDLGVVYDTASEYRRAVDSALFDLGEERYRALIELLLQLRRPQLSKTLDPSALSGLMATSLPPLDPQKIIRLADAFEQLERLEADLAVLRRSHELMTAFLEEYRGYARIVSVRLAHSVRAATTRVDNVTRAVREAKTTLEKANTELESIAGSKERNGVAFAAAESALRAFESSDEMQGVYALQRAREEAGRALEHVRRAGESLRMAQNRRDERARLAERARDVAEKRAAALVPAVETARAAAGRAAFGARHEAHEAALLSDPEGAYDALKGAVSERRKTLAELLSLRGRVDAEERNAQTAAVAQEDAAARTSEARAALEGAAAARDSSIAVLEDSLHRWRASLNELRLDDRVFATLLECAGRAGTDETPDPARMVADLARGAAGLIGRERAEATSRRNRLAGEISEIELALEAAASARDDGPTARRERPGRGALEGAPLWRLCDFADDLDHEARAGLEAALEDSGLLDAWVTPDGRVLDPQTLDVFLIPEPVGGRTLAAALVPESGPRVPEPTVAAVLGSISLGPSGTHRVDVDGSWQLGPVTGRWRKESAEYIGGGAREAARRRRIAELETRRAELAGAESEVGTELETLDEREERLRAEQESLPSTAAVLEARVNERVAARELAASEEVLAHAGTRLAAARRNVELAAARLAETAARAGLGDHVDRLPELGDAVGRYWEEVSELRYVASLAAGAGAEAEGAQAHLREADDDVARAASERDGAERAAAASRAEADALEARFEGDHGDILRRREERAAAVAAARAERDALAAREADVRGRIGRAEAELERAEDERREREHERAAAVESFTRLVTTGVLGLVVDGDDSETGTPWSATRALEVARALAQRSAGTRTDDDAHDDSRNKVSTFLASLQRDLGGDFRLVGEESHGIFLVRVEHQGREFLLQELTAFLAEEVFRRGETFDEKERRVVEQHLLKELGLHLQARLDEAGRLVKRMNALLAENPTASGLSVRLRWKPNSLTVAGVDEALRLLRKNLSLMSDDERAALARFLQQRIEDARTDENVGSYADHLSDALDYRTWHSFELQQVKDGRVETLTKKRHGTGSGGEKSVVLHLPLFAAAAAHYHSAAPYAPRLITLDEAFAGIDQGMRGRCMGLLVSFDLDFVMTSHDEWGCYSELDGLATYQLARDPARRGVGTVRFTWNGVRLEEAPAANG